MGVSFEHHISKQQHLNMKAFIATLFLAATAYAAGPPPAPYGAPVDTPPVYAYEYAVADDYSKANFAQNEKRDGYSTLGEYRVALPDGRTQIVTYNVADGYSGYVADVRYEGVAQYPEYKPAPSYAPAPTYKPAPTYHA